MWDIRYQITLRTSRITSNKIRIETNNPKYFYLGLFSFQNNIQQNKDWNNKSYKKYGWLAFFQNNIQQNKDWNLLRDTNNWKIFSSRITSNKIRIETVLFFYNLLMYMSSRITSNKIRIETWCGSAR